MAATSPLTATQLLRQRHDEIDQLFEVTLTADLNDRADAFERLRASIAAHETTEEICVHPIARELGGRAEHVVDACLTDERALKLALARLESLGVDDEEFVTLLGLFRYSVRTHFAAEDRELFPMLEAWCPAEYLDDMANAILVSEALAPQPALAHH